MRETERIIDQIQRAYEKNAWHGPALLETLENVAYKDASARIEGGSHSIWELVLHLTQWKDMVRKRMSGETIVDVEDSVDWPALPEATPENWTTTLERMQRAHDELVKVIRASESGELMRLVPGKDYTFYVMLLGSAQHDDYHGGQISLLKRMARAKA